MQFLPLIIGFIASTTVLTAIAILVISLHNPTKGKGKSPHHRWNTQTDLINEQERAALNKMGFS